MHWDVFYIFKYKFKYMDIYSIQSNIIYLHDIYHDVTLVCMHWDVLYIQKKDDNVERLLVGQCPKYSLMSFISFSFFLYKILKAYVFFSFSL